jgi:hypothetical protein
MEFLNKGGNELERVVLLVDVGWLILPANTASRYLGKLSLAKLADYPVKKQ